MNNLFKQMAKGLIEHLPVWYFWLSSLMTTSSSLSMFEKPHYDFIWTIVFPWTVLFLYFYAHFKSSKNWLKPWVPLTALSVITLAFFLYIINFTEKSNLDESSYKLTYEISNLCCIFLIMIHCAWYQGKHGFIRFFVIALFYGFLLESSGVQMGFFSEEGYHIYVPGFHAPLITMIGWSVVFYPCVLIYEKYKNVFFNNKDLPVAYCALMIAGIALCFDFQIDPFASAYGLWSWNETLNPWFLGVPLLNFVSWFWAVFMFGIAYCLITQKEDWHEQKKHLIFLASVPLIQTMAGIGVFTVMTITEGFNGPSMTILKNYLSNLI